jgi:hypothetical protein
MESFSTILGIPASKNLLALYEIQEAEQAACLADPLFKNMQIKRIPRMNLSTLSREDLLEMGRKALSQ